MSPSPLLTHDTKMVQPLAGASRNDDARKLIDEILNFDGSPETRKLFHEHPERAENADEIRHLQSKIKSGN